MDKEKGCMNPELLKNIKAALTFLGQAQELAPNQSDLWKEIGKVWDEVDTILDMVETEEYSPEGKVI